MSPFVTFKDTDKGGIMQYYILQRAYPHYVGRISYFPKGDVICEVPVTAHNLYITFSGTIRGNFMESYVGSETQIQAVFDAMALWFYENRIIPDPRRYKKWLIPV